MTGTLLLLFAAVVLLLVPTGAFHGDKVRLRSIRRDWTDHWRQIFSLGLHSVDFCRAALGGWLLALALDKLSDAGLPILTAPTVNAFLVLSAILLQTLVCREPASMNAPFAYLAGLVFGLYSPVVAGFAVIFAVVLSGGARMAIAFFPLLAVFLAGFGLFFGNMKLTSGLVIGVIAILLPWLGSLLFSRVLVISYRAKRTDDPLSPLATPKR